MATTQNQEDSAHSASESTKAQVLANVRFPELPADCCSLNTAGNLPGTASYEQGWVALEQPGSWGRDAYDGVAGEPDLGARLKSHLKASGGFRFLLIRKPGRAGQLDVHEPRRVFIARSTPGKEALFSLTVHNAEELLHLPLGEPEKIPGVRRVEDVLTLMCAHSKRDRCCALRGRPIAQFLAQLRPEGTVWECSHLSGHRFAPTGMLLPSGYTYGRMSPEGALAATACLEENNVPIFENLRGRSSLPAAAQVAEVAVRKRLFTRGEEPRMNELNFKVLDSANTSAGALTVQVRHTDGRAWEVFVEQSPTEPVAASCGKTPKPATSFTVADIHEI